YVEELARRVEVFVFQPPQAPIPELLRYGVKEGDSNPQTIKDHAIELSNRLEDNTKLSSTERDFNPLFIINRLHEPRQTKVEEIRDTARRQSEKAKEPPIFIGRRFGEGVRDWGEQFLDSAAAVFKDTAGQIKKADKEAWTPFLKKLGARIAKIGRVALET